MATTATYSRLIALAFACMLFAGCVSQNVRQQSHYTYTPAPPAQQNRLTSQPITSSAETPSKDEAEANSVLFHAFNLVGTPYRWGGNSPDNGFDCSGLVVYVYGKAINMSLPRTSRAMSHLHAPKIRKLKNLRSGDLLFFRTEGRHISHVAIYIGDGRFVHAPSSKSVVRLDTINNPYWRRHFAFARRIIDNQQARHSS